MRQGHGLPLPVRPWIPEAEGSFSKLRRMPEQVRLPCFISHLLPHQQEQASEPAVNQCAWAVRFAQADDLLRTTGTQITTTLWPRRLDRFPNSPVTRLKASSFAGITRTTTMKVTNHTLYAVFAADDAFAPMIILPARDADHAIERARLVRSSFPTMRLGPPASSRQIDPDLDTGWFGVGVISEVVLSALENDVAQRHERSLLRHVALSRTSSDTDKSR